MSGMWKDMDPDDVPGYLIDYIVSWAKKHDVTCAEDLYQQDSVNEDLPDFVEEILTATGVIENE